MQLSQRTFEAYYWHLLESPALYFSPRPLNTVRVSLS